MDIVVGGGKFGLKAVEYLLRERREFIVLDPNPECEVARVFNVPILKGAERLIEIAERNKPESIFPTAPVHVAVESLKDLFEPWNEAIDEILPIATACNCHGVITALKRIKKR